MRSLPLRVAVMMMRASFVKPSSVAPLALLSRPDGVGLAWDRLVLAPAKYVWVDPLGSH